MLEYFSMAESVSCLVVLQHSLEERKHKSHFDISILTIEEISLEIFITISQEGFVFLQALFMVMLEQQLVHQESTYIFEATRKNVH